MAPSIVYTEKKRKCQGNPRQTHEMKVCKNKHSGACHGKTPWRGTAFCHDTPHHRLFFIHIFLYCVFRVDIEWGNYLLFM
jgi:hypothetical protein